MSSAPQRRVTLRDVAEKAGVSRSAVSRTFTEGASVSQTTRGKVMSAAKSLGYSPNVLASSLTTGRTMLIGLVVDNFSNPIFLRVFDQFTRLIQKQGFRPLIVNLSDDTLSNSPVDTLRQYSVDGVIVASSTLPTSLAAEFREANIPVVHSFGRSEGKARTHVVGVDNVYCGELAGQTLLNHGYRKVGFLGGPENATTTIDRLHGFSQAMAERGLGFSKSFAMAYSYEAGVTEMRRLIAAGPPADAYFCGDDQLAVGAMDALAEAGFVIPRDVGILGMNDMDMAHWNCVRLSTIRQPIRQIIGTSVDLVVSQIADPQSTPKTRLLPCEVILRDTLKSV